MDSGGLSASTFLLTILPSLAAKLLPASDAVVQSGRNSEQPVEIHESTAVRAKTSKRRRSWRIEQPSGDMGVLLRYTSSYSAETRHARPLRSLRPGVEEIADDEAETADKIIQVMSKGGDLVAKRESRALCTWHAKAHALASGELLVSSDLPLNCGWICSPNHGATEPLSA